MRTGWNILRADQKIGVPGAPILPLKKAFLGGRASRPPERKPDDRRFNCGIQDCQLSIDPYRTTHIAGWEPAGSNRTVSEVSF